jgi:hypothetical protein
MALTFLTPTKHPTEIRSFLRRRTAGCTRFFQGGVDEKSKEDKQKRKAAELRAATILGFVGGQQRR